MRQWRDNRDRFRRANRSRERMEGRYRDDEAALRYSDASNRGDGSGQPDAANRASDSEWSDASNRGDGSGRPGDANRAGDLGWSDASNRGDGSGRPDVSNRADAADRVNESGRSDDSNRVGYGTNCPFAKLEGKEDCPYVKAGAVNLCPHASDAARALGSADLIYEGDWDETWHYDDDEDVMQPYEESPFGMEDMDYHPREMANSSYGIREDAWGTQLPFEDDGDATLPGELEPMDVINGFQVRVGFFRMQGAHMTTSGVSFTISSQGATSCTLLLFHPRESEPYAEIPFPEEYHIGNTFSMLVYGLRIAEFEYAYRMEGPYDPKKGLLFDKKNVILDPFAVAVTGQQEWGKRPENDKEFVYKARVVHNTFEWGMTRQLEHPFEDLIIYEMHVRGFTKDESSGVKERGTYEGLRKKIPYLKDLGVNAVELMPIFEFDEMESARVVDGVQLYNYWGYNTVSFFAPNTAYTYQQEHNHEGDELKRLIKDLKKNGIEVILDVVFNHTAEGDENGPCFSFKGLDNNIYYMLTPDAKYYNFSGCGNAINANHPIVRQFILECLRHWVIDYRVDGFRFDLASILGRDQNGVPMERPPILEAMAFDTILGKTKLIAEAWDAAGLYQVGTFPSWNRWAEWNGRYRDDMRSFLKGDPGMAGAAIERLTGSRDIYNPEQRETWASINFITCHDGFTLYDLYSYNVKHNEGNGWNNTDGDNNGHSWNCGVEGESDDPRIHGLRMRLVKNAFAALLCSRGVPMFLAGDEFCNTQFGNNNAYCQDNIISWLDWTRLDKYKEIHDFVRFMIQFRKDHPILRKRTHAAQCQYPEISIHNGYPNNHATDYGTHMIGVMYAGRNPEDTEDDVIFYCMNSYWEPLTMQLPMVPPEWEWRVVVNTACEYVDGCDYQALTGFMGMNMVSVPERTTIILRMTRRNS